MLRPEVAAFLAGPGRALRFPDPPPLVGTPAAAAYLAAVRAPRPARPESERRPLARVWEERVEGGPVLRVYDPGAAGSRPALVYLHGGGWVMGDLEMHDATCRALADLAGLVVVSVDYRLAPEHPHPAALEDALAAIAWVRARAPRLGVDPARIAVGGSSAGGNLAAAAAIALSGEVAAQLLLYPLLDSRLATASIGEFGHGHLLDRAQLAFYWDAYAPLARVDRTVPLVSPAHARTLGGLPPAVIVSAEHDPLRDEAEQYAARLRADGVRVELRRVRGQIHGFLALFQEDEEVEALLARVASDLSRLLG